MNLQLLTITLPTWYTKKGTTFSIWMTLLSFFLPRNMISFSPWIIHPCTYWYSPHSHHFLPFWNHHQYPDFVNHESPLQSNQLYSLFTWIQYLFVFPFLNLKFAAHRIFIFMMYNWINFAHAGKKLEAIKKWWWRNLPNFQALNIFYGRMLWLNLGRNLYLECDQTSRPQHSNVTMKLNFRFGSDNHLSS